MIETKKTNPFPLQGVISLIGAPSQKLRTVPTRIFNEVVELSVNYVRDEIGKAITVTGPHGSGKTHLIHYCMEEVRKDIQERNDTSGSVDSQSVRALQLYAKIENPDFIALYKQLIRKVNYTLLREVNVRFLGYIAKKEIDKTDITELLKWLPVNEQTAISLQYQQQQQQAKSLVDTKPETVFSYFDRLILQPETILGERSETLKEIGGDDFKKAFYYLDKEKIGEEIAYKWFLGEKLSPDEMLRIGVKNSLSTADEFKNALILLTTLFKYAGIRLFIYLDQVERLLAGNDQENNAGILHTLVESFQREKAFLLLAGSNEGMRIMRPDFWQRIQPVKMEQMSFQEAHEFIKVYIQEGDTYSPYNRIEDIFPFSEEAVQKLVDLCGGNRRRFLQTCHLAYQQYNETGSLIDVGIVKLAIQKSKHIYTLPAAKELIRTILQKKGFKFKEQVKIAGAFEADILIGDENNPSAIIEITDPLHILEEVEKALDITNFKAELNRNYPNTKFFVVALGYISTQVITKLKTIVDDCIVYDGEEFPEKFEILLRTLDLRKPVPVIAQFDQSILQELTEKIKKELLDTLTDVKPKVLNLGARLQNYSEVQKEERQKRINSPRNVEWRTWLRADQEKWDAHEIKLKTDANEACRQLYEAGKLQGQKKLQIKFNFYGAASLSVLLFAVIETVK